MMDELEALFETLQDEEEERLVSVKVGRAIPHVVMGEMPVLERVEDVLTTHADVPFAAEIAEVARQATVGMMGEFLHTDGTTVGQTDGTEHRMTEFVRQVEVAQSKVAQSVGLRGAVTSLGQRAMQSANEVSQPLDWSDVPLGVDRAMERDVRRYDGGF